MYSKEKETALLVRETGFVDCYVLKSPEINILFQRSFLKAGHCFSHRTVCVCLVLHVVLKNKEIYCSTGTYCMTGVPELEMNETDGEKE